MYDAVQKGAAVVTERWTSVRVRFELVFGARVLHTRDTYITLENSEMFVKLHSSVKGSAYADNGIWSSKNRYL